MLENPNHPVVYAVAQLLIELGADPTLTDKEGISILNSHWFDSKRPPRFYIENVEKPAYESLHQTLLKKGYRPRPKFEIELPK